MQWKLICLRTFLFVEEQTASSCCLHRKRTVPKLVFLDSNNLTTSLLRTAPDYVDIWQLFAVKFENDHPKKLLMRTSDWKSQQAVSSSILNNFHFVLFIGGRPVHVGLVCGRYFSDWRFIRHTISDMSEAIFFLPRQGAGRSKTGCLDTHSRLP